jgi:hypothetical protein
LLLPDPPQKRPIVPSQGGIPVPHTAPDIAVEAMHVPIIVCVAPTQPRSGPQGFCALQEAPLVPGTAHRLVMATHSWPRAQFVAVQELPTGGALPQVPQMLVLLLLQYVLAHWALNAQRAPAALGPLGMHETGRLLFRKSVQESPAYPAAHVSSCVVVFPLIGAARAIEH